MREELRTISDMTAEERIQRTREALEAVTLSAGEIVTGDHIRAEIVRDDDKKHGREKTSVSVGQCRNIVRSYLGGYDRFADDAKRRCVKMPGVLYVSLEDYLNACYNEKFGQRVVIPDAAWDMLIAEERTRREAEGLPQ